MRILTLACAFILGGCAVDPAAYDSQCMRLKVPDTFSEKSRTTASSSPTGTGAIPEQVSKDGVLEVNCGESAYEKPADRDAKAAEPKPL